MTQALDDNSLNQDCDKLAFCANEIFDGKSRVADKALLTKAGKIVGLIDQNSIPTEYQATKLAPGLVTAGLVDLQVNGGGEVLFNEDTSVIGLETIAKAHLQLGTTSLLATLITAPQQKTVKAVEASIQAANDRTCSVIGLHLEGPHLAADYHGAHDQLMIRPLTEADLNFYQQAASKLPALKLTVAAETVDISQISQLVAADAIISLGHSGATFEQASSAIDAGASCVTHLFNAMSPLHHRVAGLAGAALVRGDVAVGLIADGHHVCPQMIKLALAAKQGPKPIFLVSDAMSPVGSNQSSFNLDGKTVQRQNGSLRFADGSLAGADLYLLQAVRYLVDKIGVKVEKALQMASIYPAEAIGLASQIGSLQSGCNADFILLDDKLQLIQTYRFAQLVAN